MTHIGTAVALAFAALACGGGTRTNGRAVDSSAGRVAVAGEPVAPAAAAPTRAPLSAKERAFYTDVARSALAYLTSNYQASTGLVNATPDWANTTMWDVGAQLLGFMSAKEVGLLSSDEFDKRMTKTLQTLEHMKLYRGAAYAKLYSTHSAGISAEGRAGWSATDLGRFLLALKILAVREPKYAAQAERIARRNDFSQIVKDGYLYGQLIGSNGQPWTFQEGRIGYEQYFANGFSLWGAHVDSALSLHANGEPIDVMGVQLLADKRFQDRLLSEPFILEGLELGLTGDMKTLAQSVLAAQEARYKSTGKLTAVSEDAMADPPDYFYYYCVLCDRQPFVVETAEGHARSAPRWVSTKAAFGWQAVLPDDYTRKLADYVAAAHDPKRGWASGVYEGTGASTNAYDINSSSVLLEVAAFELNGGKPLLQRAVR